MHYWTSESNYLRKGHALTLIICRRAAWLSVISMVIVNTIKRSTYRTRYKIKSMEFVHAWSWKTKLTGDVKYIGGPRQK